MLGLPFRVIISLECYRAVITLTTLLLALTSNASFLPESRHFSAKFEYFAIFLAIFSSQFEKASFVGRKKLSDLPKASCSNLNKAVFCFHVVFCDCSDAAKQVGLSGVEDPGLPEKLLRTTAEATSVRSVCNICVAPAWPREAGGGHQPTAGGDTDIALDRIGRSQLAHSPGLSARWGRCCAIHGLFMCNNDRLPGDVKQSFLISFVVALIPGW